MENPLKNPQSHRKPELRMKITTTCMNYWSSERLTSTLIELSSLSVVKSDTGLASGFELIFSNRLYKYRTSKNSTSARPTIPATKKDKLVNAPQRLTIPKARDMVFNGSIVHSARTSANNGKGSNSVVKADEEQNCKHAQNSKPYKPWRPTTPSAVRLNTGAGLANSTSIHSKRRFIRRCR